MQRVGDKRPHIVVALTLTFVACLGICAPPAAAQAADEAAIRSLMDRFFDAYRKSDVARLMALWSKQSPELSDGEQALRQALADDRPVELRGYTVADVRLNGDRASARVCVEFGAVDAGAGTPAGGARKINRTAYFVREAAGWKLWRYVPAEEELAAALAAARTDAERRALLNERKELMSAELVKNLIEEGRTLFGRGDFVAALGTFDAAREVAEKVGDRAGLATAVRQVGNVHAAQGDYGQALESYQTGLKLSEEVGDRAGVAGTLSNIGNVYDWLGDRARALEHYERSLSIATELKHSHLLALVLNNTGTVYKSEGDALKALEYFQRSLRLAEEMKDPASISRALFNIGTVHSSQRNYPQALEYYQKSLAIEQERGARPEITRILGNIGLAYFEQREYAPAIEYHQKALKLAEQLGDKEVIAGSLNNIGDVYAAEGHYPQALDYYRKGLALAEGIGNKSLVADAWHDMAEVYLHLGDYTKAVEHADHSAAVALQHDLQTVFWEARTVAGKAHLALGSADLARRSLLEAISTIEKLRSQVAGGEQDRQRFFENKVAPYYAMVDLSLAEGDPYQALTYAERAKGRVLLDVLSNGRVNVTKAMTAEEQERERELNAEVVAVNTQISRERSQQAPDPVRLADLRARRQKAQLAYDAFQTGLYAAHPELKLKRGQLPTLSPGQAGALLRDTKTALLEFVVGEERSYLFALTRGDAAADSSGGVGLKTYTINVKGKDLAARVEDFRERLATRNLEFREPARRLYDLLLRPAREQLRGRTLLCIVPDGVLWELPFQALQPRERGYLIEDHALFYAPSLSVLQGVERLSGRRANVAAARYSMTAGSRESLSREMAPASDEPLLLAFGNPSLSPEVAERAVSVNRDERLNPLPEAEQEVKRLLELYSPSHSRVYVGADAQEGRAKAEMGSYRLLHFATHGILDDGNPMYSHLLMSQTPQRDGEDGLLHAWEIMRLDLRAEMTVLSACQTARGRLGAGEGVVGMSWALFVAGSPTTVVSQWNVESRSTTRLMVEFHRRLLAASAARKPGLSKAEALRRASLGIMSDGRYEHPFYWAGFIMVGDGM